MAQRAGGGNNNSTVVIIFRGIKLFRLFCVFRKIQKPRMFGAICFGVCPGFPRVNCWRAAHIILSFEHPLCEG